MAGETFLIASMINKIKGWQKKIKPRYNYVFIGKIRFYISQILYLHGGGRFMVLLVTILIFQIAQIYGALKLVNFNMRVSNFAELLTH